MQMVWPIPKIRYLSLEEVNEERQVALVTSGPAWEAVQSRLNLPVVWQTEVIEATVEDWDNLFRDCRGEVVYAVGGGLPIDAGKYLAVKKDIPLIGIPTAVSVDAFMTWASGIRVEGGVRYIETTIPSELIVDLHVIADAPPRIRSAGLCDVLSIATGLWDWKFAQQRGATTPETVYDASIANVAQAILDMSLACATSAGRGEAEGLKRLLECIALESQLLNIVGHARPEEGSEHYFAYLVENKVGHGLPHADLVCPGILLIAELQGQDIIPLKQAMKAAHIPLDRIPVEAIIDTLYELPEYSNKHQYLYGIAHELTRKQVNRLDIPKILA
jgi:glycerol-1-phosphate dehydrogenase [NAD(P)+]